MLKDGILGLFTAVIIMGGIMSGICTATESEPLQLYMPLSSHSLYIGMFHYLEWGIYLESL